MNSDYKGKTNLISASVPASLLVILTFLFSPGCTKFHNSLTTEGSLNLFSDMVLHIADTIPVKKSDSVAVKSNPEIPFSDTLQPFSIADTGKVRRDTIPVIDTFSFKTSTQGLDAPVNYHADDSMVFDVPAKKMYLYGKTSNLKYLDNDLSAPRIEYDQNTNLVKAIIMKDSLGNVISAPSFNQGDLKTVSDTIAFNMRTQKGITKGTYTQQGEMYVYGEVIKKVSDDVFYALRGRFTTCNLDTPHFAFVSKKIKFINQKMAFTGPVHPEFEGVPVPVILPFGIYPLKQGRHSGFIAPTFLVNDQTGIALEGLGYYKILSETWDVVSRGTIHSYGGWNASVNPRYYRRYRYQGNFSVNMQNFKTNFKGDPDYQATKTVLFQWSHNADTKARPGVGFYANVNAGSSKYNSSIPNNPVRNFTNQMSSSISYSKVWKDKPYNLAVSANHNQNTQQRLINLNLPDVNFNVNTLYPFRRKEPIGNLKWYENVGVALNTNARSLSSFYDTAGQIFKQLADNMQWGANHRVPISLSLPEIGPLQVAPSVSYEERWYQRKFIRRWNPATEKLDTVINKGFYTARDMNFGLGASTRIFGMFTFGKKSRIQAMRHEIRPSLSINYKPDLNRHNFYSTIVDTFDRVQRFSVYEGSVFSPFGEGKFGGLSFGIDNILSMKVKDKKDTSAAALKKVTLIDGLGINGSYNFLQDSFKLSDLTMNFRTNLFDKVNITGNATFDPYLMNSDGQRIDKLVWSKNPLSLGRLTRGGIAVQSSFRGGDKKSGADVNTPPNVDASGLSLDEYQHEAAYIRDNPGEFADFSIPWSIDFSYSMQFYKERKLETTGFNTRFFQDVNWNASVNLTPKWKVGVNGSYNITEKQIGMISMYLSREMHCWQMNIQMSPVGKYRFFSINISPKSGLLRDLKINRTRSFYDL